jgi:hypothetical protein
MKKEYLILIALIVGLSAYLILRDSDKIEYELPEVPHMAKNAVTSIGIQKAGKALLVSKEGGKWVMGEKRYTADANKVDAMLKAIEEFKLTAMVSESKNYERYNLTDEKKITVKAKDKDGKTFAFEIGKTAGTHRHSFVKIPDDPRVFHGSGNLEGDFDVDEEILRDRVVMQFSPEEITEVALKHKDQSLILVLKTLPAEEKAEEPISEKPGKDKPVTEKDLTGNKESKKWQTANGKPVDETQVKTLLSELAHLRCRTYLPGKTTEDFKSPLYTLELKGAATYSLTLFDKESKEAEEFQAVSSASSEPFVLPKWVAEKIMPDFANLVQSGKAETKEAKPDKD